MLYLSANLLSGYVTGLQYIAMSLMQKPLIINIYKLTK